MDRRPKRNIKQVDRYSPSRKHYVLAPQFNVEEEEYDKESNVDEDEVVEEGEEEEAVQDEGAEEGVQDEAVEEEVEEEEVQEEHLTLINRVKPSEVVQSMRNHSKPSSQQIKQELLASNSSQARRKSIMNSRKRKNDTALSDYVETPRKSPNIKNSHYHTEDERNFPTEAVNFPTTSTEVSHSAHRSEVSSTEGINSASPSEASRPASHPISPSEASRPPTLIEAISSRKSLINHSTQELTDLMNVFLVDDVLDYTTISKDSKFLCRFMTAQINLMEERTDKKLDSIKISVKAIEDRIKIDEQLPPLKPDGLPFESVEQFKNFTKSDDRYAQLLAYLKFFAQDTEYGTVKRLIEKTITNDLSYYITYTGENNNNRVTEKFKDSGLYCVIYEAVVQTFPHGLSKTSQKDFKQFCMQSLNAARQRLREQQKKARRLEEIRLLQQDASIQDRIPPENLDEHDEN